MAHKNAYHSGNRAAGVNRVQLEAICQRALRLVAGAKRLATNAGELAYHTSARRGGSVVRDHAERIAAEALALVESVRELYPT